MAKIIKYKIKYKIEYKIKYKADQARVTVLIGKRMMTSTRRDIGGNNSIPTLAKYR